METKIVRDVAPRSPRSQSAGLCVYLFEAVRLSAILAGTAGLMVACSALVTPAKAAETGDALIVDFLLTPLGASLGLIAWVALVAFLLWLGGRDDK